MSLRSALARARRSTAETYSETVSIGTLSYSQGPNRETVESIGAPVYSPDEDGAGGAGRIKWDSMTTTDVEVAGQTVTKQTPLLKVPVGTAGITEGMVVLVLSSTVDPGLVGRQFRIAGNPHSGQVSSLRFPLSEEST